MSNVNIVITTKQSNHNEWMTFASWYSIHQNMPHAKVYVIFPRDYKVHHFLWLNRCHIPYLTYGSEITESQAIKNLGITDCLVMKDTMMLISEIDLSFSGVVYAEESKFYTKASGEDLPIVDYSECGKFNLDDWIKKEKKHPFCKSFTWDTSNEQKIFDLWKLVGDSFDFINRS